MNDKERMDLLEQMFSEAAENGYYRIALRKSTTGRGLRLHHMKGFNPTFPTVRAAIDAAAIIRQAE